MANLIRRYRTTGPTTTQLGFLVNGVVAVSTSKGHAYVDVTYDDAVAAVSTLDNAMLSKGWAFFETAPPANVARTVEQAHAAELGSNASIGATFEDVLTLSLDSRGGSLLLIHASAVAASVALTAEVQIVVDGGDVDNEAKGPCAIPILAGGTTAFAVMQELPGSADRVTYTIKLQARRNALGALTLLAKATALSTVEYR